MRENRHTYVYVCMYISTYTCICMYVYMNVYMSWHIVQGAEEMFTGTNSLHNNSLHD